MKLPVKNMLLAPCNGWRTEEQKKILTAVQGRTFGEANVHSANLWSKLGHTLLLVIFYYLSSIGLTFYQSWLMKSLQLPLTIVLCHFFLKLFLASWCRTVQTLHSGRAAVSLDWRALLGRVGLVAVVTSFDIGLSQWSLEYVDVALYTVTKSSSIVFILLWAVLLRLEPGHWSLLVIVVIISTGLAMVTYKSTQFVLSGFIMLLSASFLSGKIHNLLFKKILVNNC